MFYLFGADKGIMRFYPFNVLLNMVRGSSDISTVGVFLTAALTVVLFIWAMRNTKKMFKSVGGVKL
ncbi:hypothetical protein SDC9_121266 [bioreactor metagenome]|uniref:Uncharacterized protein n=1 Tax=bioreactor metagenome TaxID=1076179 RepID=A0A645CBI0_9ZZZZ